MCIYHRKTRQQGGEYATTLRLINAPMCLLVGEFYATPFVCVLTSAGAEVPCFDEDAARARFADDAAPVVVRASVAGAQLVGGAETGQRGRVARPRTVHTHRGRRRHVQHALLPFVTRQLLTRQTL